MTKRTSTSYLMTLDVNSVCDMEMLEVIKKTIKITTDRNPNKKRVVLRGRKPEQKIVNPRTSKLISYDAGGNILGGIKNATKIDVYVYDRRD